MDIITGNKVQLINWLSGEDFILQHVQSRKLISRAEYDKVKSIQEPRAKITELLDTIMRKGNSTCVAFLQLLKEDSVTESRPELREFMRTVNPSEIIKAAPQTSVQSSAAGTSVHVTATDGTSVCTPIIFNSQISSIDMKVNLHSQKNN